ncbi:MAG: ribosomal protein S18-alanine N-acetyltransferase [Candidatus Thermoplasmatota archaeon]|nr:ribosomal protein S18-alanine N-acetyltransferase [Candidatus Thermoplasmatota archaeon]
MIIREFVCNDIQQVIKISYNSLKEYYSPDFFINVWQVSPNGFLVAEEGGKVIGFVLSVMAGASTLRILMVCVRKGYRGKGIGSTLLNQITRKFENLKKVYLEVKVTNKKAIKLYKKHGFVIKEILHDFYPDGTDGYLMEKSLL